jgi:hypothetical protein
MSTPEEIAERAEEIFKRVNRDPAYRMPVFDDPVSRVMGTEVSAVMDLIGDLTIGDVHMIILHLQRKGISDEDREALAEVEKIIGDVVDRQQRRKGQEE